jgi:SagB-type dehydrogenase family enzyme
MTENVGKEFMERTKYRYLEKSPQERNLTQPPLQIDPSPDDIIHTLPQPKEIKLAGLDLREAIEQRVSVRQYSQEPLTLEELSLLLWLTQGVKEVTRQPVTLRTVPSAGARHAFETYILANRVMGLAPGLYRFLAIEHALVEVDLSEGIAERFEQACRHQKMVTRSAVTFFWTAVVERMTWRHVSRGYRYLHLDAGHVCQNLYLTGEAIGCGTCAIAVFNDDEANQILGLDGEKQFLIYLATLGKKKIE